MPSSLSSPWLPSMIMCALEGCAFAGFMAISGLGEITHGCVGTKRQGGEETSAEKCNPDLKGLATPWACELSAEENPVTNCRVGLGCIWRMVVRPEQTSLSADLFSG